jgi:hypothetical protein
VLPPADRFALDALPFDEILTYVAGPEYPVGFEVESELFGTHYCLVHDPQFQAAPVCKLVVIHTRGIADSMTLHGS